MSLPQIIGISGKMGSGKSTFVKHMKEKYPQYQHMSIGDEVKKACSRLFNFPLEWCYSQEGKDQALNITLPGLPGNYAMNVRTVLQWWGTDIIRSMVGRDHWLNELAKGIGWNYAIIDDIRFKNEADFVKAACGVLIRIENYDGKPVSSNDNHISETDLDDYTGFDIVLFPQYGQLKQFAEQVCLESLHGKGKNTQYLKRG